MRPSVEFPIIHRECSFISKVLSAEQVGALGVIIVDNNQLVNDQYVDMIDDLTQRTVKIPAVFITYRDGFDFDTAECPSERCKTISLLLDT